MLRFLIGIICILLHRPKKVTLAGIVLNSESVEFTVFIYTVINVLHYMMKKSIVNKRDYLQHDAS